PHIEITIADTGVGLSPEAQKYLFADPFFTTKPRRHGFGLAVTYGILAAHHGGLRLHPRAERGVGARGLVPVAPVPVGRLAEAETRPIGRASAKVHGERILVVDDEREVLQLVRATLEQAGYRVEGAGSGEAALEAYARAGRDPFRLVLADVVM